MTKTLNRMTKVWILLFGISMFFTACQKESTDQIITQKKFNAPNIDLAKHFVNSNSNSVGLSKSSDNSTSVTYWEGSKNKKYKLTEAQDVDILYTPIYVKSPRTDIKGFIASTTQNGIIDARKIYVLYKSNDLSRGLSAYILIYGIDGVLQLAYNYENGQSVPLPENNSNGNLNKSSSCDGDISAMSADDFENWWANCGGIELGEITVTAPPFANEGPSGGSTSAFNDWTNWANVYIPIDPNYDENTGGGSGSWHTPNVTVGNAPSISAVLDAPYNSAIANWLREMENTNPHILSEIAEFLNENREENPFSDLTFGNIEPEQFPISEDTIEYITDLINFLDDNPELDMGGISQQEFNDLEDCYENNGNFVVCFEEQIINKLDNPCARQIFNELEDGIYVDDILSPEMQVPISNLGDILNLNFSESILHLFNSSDSTHLIIQNGNLNGGKNASTTGSTITIDNHYLVNATQLSIARTIIHESVHAYLNGAFYGYNDIENKTLQDKLREYASANGFTNINTFHHNFMGQYIDAMAYSLYEWDKEYGTGGHLSWDYYKSMVYSGMFQVDHNGNIATEIDTFIELVPNASDRQEIVDIILNEQNGNNDAQGTECD